MKNVSIPEGYIERLYAGWYGKLIGVRFGAPIEGWSYEAIQRIFGELNSYPVDYKDFAADDDSNGPMFFLRALEDYGINATAEQMGLTWLNYVSECKGFFWWGGYGRSTEHTAYLNLKNGIPAPRSGSIGQNGKAVAEQIGGQIFIDTWGLVAPGNPALAAEYARKAASVSHDGSGIYGGIFTAAAISAAFVERDIVKVIYTALSYVPEDSHYMCMAKDVIQFWKEHPKNWRDGFHFVKDNYGYDRYPGVCHMIPNAAVMLLSMLYGGGDFDNTISICNMCGWDTDCNVGNVGAIMGVLVGLEGINYDKWIAPIRDFFCASSTIGSLNIMDVPWCVSYIARLAYEIAGEQPSSEWSDFVQGKTARYHFDLPGSTHAFRSRYKQDNNYEYVIRQTTDKAYEGKGSLLFSAWRIGTAEDVYLFVKTFYKPSDFHDSRYDPSFSPTVYPGETIRCHATVPDNMSGKVSARLYCKDEYGNIELTGEPVSLTADIWTELSFTLPCGAYLISEVGIMLSTAPTEGWIGNLDVYIDSFDVIGKADFEIDFAKEKPAVWNQLHVEIGQLTTQKGLWELKDGFLVARCSDYAEAYAGRYDFRDYTFSADVVPQWGSCHRINFRVQGAIRSYAVALLAENRLALLKNANGYTELCAVDFTWSLGQSYNLSVCVEGASITVFVDGTKKIEYTDTQNPYLKGQVGVSLHEGSNALFGSLAVTVK